MQSGGRPAPGTTVDGKEKGELGHELLSLGAATVGESGGKALSPRFRAAWPGARMCGPVLTVRCRPGDNLAVHAALPIAPAGSVLVVSVGDREEHGYWGEVLTTAAETRGVKGLVIGGGVRDVSALESHAFPVFSTTIALKGASKEAGGEIGSPIELGGVSIASGDWVVADADGVTVVDGGRVTQVLEASRMRFQKEEGLFAELRRGRTTIELLGLDDSSVSKTMSPKST